MGLGRYVRIRGKRRERVAFVLSGGGVLGAIQVGQLRALIEAGIEPDLLVGTSVGALNAAAIAADPSTESVDRLADIWRSVRTEDLFPGSRVQRAVKLVRRSDHLYPNHGVRRLIDRIGARTFEELAKPLVVVAASLRDGKEVGFTAGPLTPALLASTALPGVFPPVMVNGELHIDGGVVNHTPISQAVAMGATKLYVLTCGGERPAERPIRRPLDVLVQAFAHSRATRTELDLQRYAQQVKIELLPQVRNDFIRFNDTSHTDRLMREGYESAMSALSLPLASAQ